MQPKLEAIKDCAILYVAAIGGSGAARVVAQNIHPMKVPQPEKIADLLEKLQVVLQGTPPPWLRKVMSKGGRAHLRFRRGDCRMAEAVAEVATDAAKTPSSSRS